MIQAASILAGTPANTPTTSDFTDFIKKLTPTWGFLSKASGDFTQALDFVILAGLLVSLGFLIWGTVQGGWSRDTGRSQTAVDGRTNILRGASGLVGIPVALVVVDGVYSQVGGKSPDFSTFIAGLVPSWGPFAGLSATAVTGFDTMLLVGLIVGVGYLVWGIGQGGLARNDGRSQGTIEARTHVIRGVSIIIAIPLILVAVVSV
jgi:hypothetical protein